MKYLFCSYQEKITAYDSDRIKLNCSMFNKECPYDKPNKAVKKCQQCNIIRKREENYD